MFKSLKIGWLATDIGERIEASTGYVVDSLILMGIHIKTHDTIYIFSQIYSLVTHNKYGKILDEKGDTFVDNLDNRLKYDEKRWLKKVLNISMDMTTVASIDVFFNKELDEFRSDWLDNYIKSRQKDPNSDAGQYTFNRIEEYLICFSFDL